jgi:hypothetical protein
LLSVSVAARRFVPLVRLDPHRDENTRRLR